MKRLIVMAVCVAAVSLLCGCDDGTTENSSDLPVVKAESTGVTPNLGGYVMFVNGYVYDDGYRWQRTFVVTATNMISYTSDTFAYYAIPIHDGGVSFSNGNYWWTLNGEEVAMENFSGGFPTDGFAMYAKWTAPNHCEGTMWFGTTNGLAFTADR